MSAIDQDGERRTAGSCRRFLGDREVIARFEPDEAPAVGDHVTLAVDMGKACLFDPESERLI